MIFKVVLFYTYWLVFSKAYISNLSLLNTLVAWFAFVFFIFFLIILLKYNLIICVRVLVNFDAAADILDKLLKNCPRNLTVICDRINIEQRRGDLARAEQLYETHSNDQSLGSRITSALSIKYAEFSAKVRIIIIIIG